MASKKPKAVLYRRKREKKTNYKKRLLLLKSRQPRLVVRFTNNRIIAQIIEFSPQGDLVQVGVDSSVLKKHGWNYSLKNFPAAYLTGLALGKMAIQKNQKEAILDTGFKIPRKKGKLYAFLKGALDGGMTIRYGEDKSIFPSEDQMAGKQISDFYEKIKSKENTQQFSQYLKSGVKPESISEQFKKVKDKLSMV